MREHFRKFANTVSAIVGTAWVFLLALATIIVWAISGPLFGFSDTWQLVINTGTTIITFLMVFLIQNTQNRDAKAIHLKLDELIRATGKARTKLVDLEDLSEDELEKLQDEFRELHEQYADQAQQVTEEHGRRKKSGSKTHAKKQAGK
jgi:low affinity Fe/Cu permease